jgi:hypothetical protein
VVIVVMPCTDTVHLLPADTPSTHALMITDHSKEAMCFATGTHVKLSHGQPLSLTRRIRMRLLGPVYLESAKLVTVICQLKWRHCSKPRRKQLLSILGLPEDGSIKGSLLLTAVLHACSYHAVAIELLLSIDIVIFSGR